MKIKISISIDQEVFKDIDKMRGEVNISKYISDTLKDWVEYNKPESMKVGDN